ncbi:MAG TPA: HD domain-containing protein [Methanomassiliicoccales archaeon]
MPDYKVIHDSVHGSVKLSGIYLDLLQRAEVQRLHGVHQLGLAYLVFPGAHHTRMEHSLGTYQLASRMATALDIPDHERKCVLAAALLHDIGHAPYSHTLECVLEERTGMTHTDIGKALIKGEIRTIDPKEGMIIGEQGTIADLLDAEGISSDLVTDLIVSPRGPDLSGQKRLPLEGVQTYFNENNYLRQVIHGPVDADQMDYLVRDAYYTGVAHGTIDIDRIMDTIELHHGDIAVRKSGVVAIEGLMVARALMYTSVYFHHTVRIAEMMLCKAVENASESVIEDIQIQTDGSLSERILKDGGKASRIMTLLRYRHLYKRAYSMLISDLDSEQLDSLLPLTSYEKRKEVERQIADRAEVDESEVILDMPERELLITEPRIGKTEVPIINGDRVRALSKYSPLAKAIQTRSVNDWAVMVSTPGTNQEKVRKAAEKVLFS